MSCGPGIVVVGAGQAGGVAARALRDNAYKGRLTLVGAETHLPYERPPLSKEFLTANPTSEPAWVNANEWYRMAEVDLVLGCRALRLDVAESYVELADGRRVEYENLLLATGSRSRPLDIPGAQLDGVHYLRSVDESRRFARVLDLSSELIIVGGGFIGLEVAANARKRGISVTLVETRSQLMVRAVPPLISQWMEAKHRQEGVTVLLDTEVDSVIGSDRVKGVRLTNGQELKADIVLIGVGAIPETQLAEDAGIDVSNGILVNEFCRSSVQNIFAAGDCANQLNPILGRRVRLESWNNANTQATVVAEHLCGISGSPRMAPWFWTDQFDVNLQIVGVPETWDDMVLRGDPGSGRFMLFQMEGDSVMGVVGVNESKSMLLAKQLVGSGRALDRNALSDTSQSLKPIVLDR